MSKSRSRRATVHFAFRMTPEERDVLTIAAVAKGMGPTTFARRAAFRAAGLAAPEYERRVNPVAADAARILGELGRIGNNANQMARVANQTRSAPTADAVRDLVDELRALRSSVLPEERGLT